MPRRGNIQKREILPDPKFGDVTVAKFINDIMFDGKKSVAESIVYGAFDLIEARTKDDPVKIFKRAIENAQPMLEVKSRRVGGSTYQVPIEVRPERRMALSLRWLIYFARSRPGRTMRDKLANELMDAASNRGGAVKRKEDIHRMAEANKAFAHYRW